MLSPRRLAKSLQFHARRVQISALAVPREFTWLRRRLHLPRNDVFDPLADSAPRVRVTRLDEPAVFRRPLPRLLEPSPESLAFFQTHTTEEIGASYVAELDGAVAWGHPTGGVFTADGRFVPAFTHDPCGARFHAAWARLRLPRPRPLAGRTLYLVTPEAIDNYHHWMIDLLPRLGLVQRAGYDLASFDRVILNWAARRYQQETLARFGIRADRVIAADAALSVRAEQLVVPSLKLTNQSLPPADAAFLRQSFVRGEPPGGHRRLFLSRADAGFRRLAGETELHPWLRDNGFEIITGGALTVAEQARLFSEAAVIAGPAGAAFANLVFAASPARVIEIVPPQWLAAFHWMISARLGLEHTIVLGAGAVMRGVPDASARQRDISLDPAKLVAACSFAQVPAAR